MSRHTMRGSAPNRYQPAVKGKPAAVTKPTLAIICEAAASEEVKSRKLQSWAEDIAFTKDDILNDRKWDYFQKDMIVGAQYVRQRIERLSKMPYPYEINNRLSASAAYKVLCILERQMETDPNTPMRAHLQFLEERREITTTTAATATLKKKSHKKSVSAAAVLTAAFAALKKEGKYKRATSTSAILPAMQTFQEYVREPTTTVPAAAKEERPKRTGVPQPDEAEWYNLATPHTYILIPRTPALASAPVAFPAPLPTPPASDRDSESITDIFCPLENIAREPVLATIQKPLKHETRLAIKAEIKEDRKNGREAVNAERMKRYQGNFELKSCLKKGF
ncbi:hypothetical protein YB2330_001614 [Saitoella coloradoensis]